MLAAAWGALLWSRALATAQRTAAMERRLRALLVLTREVATLRDPPDIGLLCLASPLAPSRTRRAAADGTVLERRWRHLGDAVILAELDVLDAGGGRLRVVAWVTPDSVERGAGGLRCGGGRLRTLASPSVVVRPGD